MWSRRRIKKASMTSKCQRVLVVEDDRDGAEALALTLEHEGHNVRIALDGPTALEIAAEFEPTIVLLDIELPVMDGFEVARQLRASASGPRMRIVALSGYGLDSDYDKSAEAGFDRHLLKPLDFAALESLLTA